MKSSFLVTASILILGVAQAKAGVEILRDVNGNIRHMTQFEASGVNSETGIKEKPDACETAHKGHLPTIRELVTVFQAPGTKCIWEVSEAVPDESGVGIYKISSSNPNGQKDEFYYDYECYMSQEDFGEEDFWSSSVVWKDSDYAVGLNGLGGLVYYYDRSLVDFAVLCVPGSIPET